MKKVIILSGGVGNQMFQYAFYLFLCKNGIDCRISTDLFAYITMHNGYMLGEAFGIKGGRTGLIERCRAMGIIFFHKYFKTIFEFTEIPHTYQREAIDTHKNYFYGCWISPEYAAQSRRVVKDSFSFINVSIRNMELGRKMQNENSVSVHIRRGDYLNNPTYCVCDRAYYCNAINYIQEHVSAPKFYAFSDDIEWTTKFLKDFDIDFEVIGHNQGRDSYQDIYLMQHCKHNINANSTFSWWGAWLNDSMDKIVITPQEWIKGDTNNPVPQEWIKL